jgi:hypothetical protein
VDQNRESRDEEIMREAQATLDQIRTQAGGALSGKEIKRRLGAMTDGHDDESRVSLDWRPTPKNLLLQGVAILAFIAVMGFLLMLMLDGFAAVFNHYG